MKYDALIAEVLGGNIVDAFADEVDCPCPNCGREDKFYVNREKGVGFCFRCHYARNAIGLIQDVEGLNNPDAVIRVESLTRGFSGAAKELEEGGSDGANLLRTMLNKIEGESKPVTYEFVQLPPGIGPIKGTVGEMYLRERGFSRKTLDLFRLGWCGAHRREMRHLTGHILLPDYHPVTEDLRYWTTRRAGGGSGPKSLNVKGGKKDTLYGHFTFEKDRKHCYVVEGPLDAMALPGIAISVLGNMATNDQCRAVANHFKTATVCLDTSARKYTVHIARKLVDYGVRCYVSHMGEYDDPAEALEDTGQKTTFEIIRDNAELFTPEVEVQWRLRKHAS